MGLAESMGVIEHLLERRSKLSDLRPLSGETGIDAREQINDTVFGRACGRIHDLDSIRLRGTSGNGHPESGTLNFLRTHGRSRAIRRELRSGGDQFCGFQGAMGFDASIWTTG